MKWEKNKEKCANVNIKWRRKREKKKKNIEKILM